MTALYLAVVFFVALDRFLKIYALANAPSLFNLLDGIFKFKFQANHYIAFSLPFYGFWLNAVVSIIILLLIYYLARAWQGGKRATAICLLVVVMGAASNLFDRLKHGFVIDYFDLKYFTVFNLADAMIVIGVVCLLFFMKQKRG